MKNKLVITMLMLLVGIVAMAQTPTHYPPPVPEPVEPSLFNVILYLVVPALLFIFYIFYRRHKRNKRK